MTWDIILGSKERYFVCEELEGVGVMGNQFEISVDLIGHSSFLRNKFEIRDMSYTSVLDLIGKGFTDQGN